MVEKKDWGKFTEDEDTVSPFEESLEKGASEEGEDIDLLNPEAQDESDISAEIEKYKNDYMRALADAKNIERRMQNEISKAHKYAVEKLLKELLPIVDSMEMALTVEIGDQEAVAKLHEGVELTLNMMLKSLEKFGVEQVNPEGDVFDPNKHQAMSMQEHEGEPNRIIQVMQKGYILHGRLLRPAMVIVSKAKN